MSPGSLKTAFCLIGSTNESTFSIVVDGAVATPPKRKSEKP